MQVSNFKLGNQSDLSIKSSNVASEKLNYDCSLFNGDSSKMDETKMSDLNDKLDELIGLLGLENKVDS